MNQSINVHLDTSDLGKMIADLEAKILSYTQPTLEVIYDPELLSFGKPEYKTVGSAGLDLRVILNTALSHEGIKQSNVWVYTQDEGGEERVEGIRIGPGQQITVDTGLRIHIDDPRYAAYILPRSGSGKKGLVLGNSIGLIDSDYQGPLMLVLWNRSSDPIVVVDGERVAQYVLTPVSQFSSLEVPNFTANSERGEGGFGSTGTA